MPSWKLILLIFAVVAILGLAAVYGLGITFGQGLQGFQNQTGPAPAMNTFTMYYADWCPHCQTVKPEFTEFSNRGTIEVGGKKCQIMLVDAAKNPEAAKGKPVKGFPTFLLETTDGKILEYQGERNTDGWLAFINQKMGGGI
jgi:thiol-disulfide isomerase/thioredoxin